MSKLQEIQHEVFNIIHSLLNNQTISVGEDTPLIGSESLLDSMKLVELCLLLEDHASRLGFVFDWTSDSVLSQSRSMFRTAGALAGEFIAQMEKKK